MSLVGTRPPTVDEWDKHYLQYLTTSQNHWWGRNAIPLKIIRIFFYCQDMEELLSENKTLRNSYANLKKARKRILTVGRLTAQKAYEVAVDAMKLLKDQGIKARWYVLGEGELRNKLQQKIDSLGLKEDFLLLGAKENPYPYYKQCDLYVHATRFEGKSIAIQDKSMFDTIHHIAIIGSDYEKSKHFYVDLLGFEIIRENYRKERDDYKIDLACGEQEIELFIIKDAPARVNYPEALGLRHLAFKVKSVDDTVKELNAKGIATEPVRLDDYTGKKMTFFHDPDNLPLEIHE